MPTDFQTALQGRFQDFFTLVATESGDWTVKGFIDVYQNIYTISIDTKVVSKIVELMIFPVILDFAKQNGYRCLLASHQNHYPDVTFVPESTGETIALDLKSTYRITDAKVNGMTLGAFTGYFRKRDSRKNITLPYQDYDRHFILGVIYSRTDLFNAIAALQSKGFGVSNKARKAIGVYISHQSEEALDKVVSCIRPLPEDDARERVKNLIDDCLISEKRRFALADLPAIMSVARDFSFFVQEKWKVAGDLPGSGNTKNIGSVTEIEALRNGTGPFTRLEDGEAIFNDYWRFYMTKDMARAIDSTPPYKNLAGYLEYKRGAGR